MGFFRAALIVFSSVYFVSEQNGSVSLTVNTKVQRCRVARQRRVFLLQHHVSYSSFHLPKSRYTKQHIKISLQF
jgi:hypothetical protein